MAFSVCRRRRRISKIFGFFAALFCIVFVRSQIYLNLQEESAFRMVKLVKKSWFERQYVGSWLQNKLLFYKWESYVNQYCKIGKSLAMAKSFTEDDYKEYSKLIGPQLNFEDGDSIFDNGCGCGAFLVAFNQTYKDVKVGGLDLSPGAIGFAKTIFPNQKDRFQVGTVEDLSFVQNATYDHAMTFFTFPYVNAEKQCLAVKEMLRIVKPGGSLNIGHNLETDCLNDPKKIGIYTLPLCFWNEHCLNGDRDVQEIYYIKEKELFGVAKYCSESSSVFVHKKGGSKIRYTGQYSCNGKYPSGRQLNLVSM